MVARVVKAMQRGCFSLLNTKLGATLVLLTAVIIANAVLYEVDRLMGTDIVCPKRFDDVDPFDNIGERSYEASYGMEPIDAVYTWVNGSETQHVAEVAFWHALQRQLDEAAASDTNASEVNITVPPTGTSAPAGAEDEQASASRFADHDELKYSMRSLEKFAGWVRHVYIVTNGQVPTWLDTSHPRVTIVPHSSLFVNSTDLPTFSSPAIESNLHRIPGLSRRFLYLNDDTFFGAPVVPDDFFNPTEGHRIYFSWPVPNCAEGCPSAWLSDGYCDKACNTTDCEWDGGDCLGNDVQVAGGNYDSYAGYAGRGASSHTLRKHGSGGQAHSPGTDAWCSRSCNDGWLGDRFCDAVCNVPECGFDATDCGMGVYEEGDRVPKLEVTALRHNFVLPQSTRAVLVNLTEFFPMRQSRIASASHDDPSWVRSATISQPNKVLVVTLMKEPLVKYKAHCLFEVRGRKIGDEGETHVAFNITLVPDPPAESNDGKSASATLTARAPVDSAPASTPEPSAMGDDDEEMVKMVLKLAKEQDSAKVRQRYMELRERGVQLDTKDMETLRRELQQVDKEHHNRRQLLQATSKTQDEDTWRVGLEKTLPRNTDQKERQGTRRRLLDMFGDSLKYGNNLMSRKYGPQGRKVPAHMVHMIDKTVIEALWEQFPAEWAATSASKFRSKRNVQYAFMHFYHIIHSLTTRNATALFDDLVDLDNDGVIGTAAEVRRLGLLLWEKEVPIEMVEDTTLAALESLKKNSKNVESTKSATLAADEEAKITPPPIPGQTSRRQPLAVPTSDSDNGLQVGDEEASSPESAAATTDSPASTEESAPEELEVGTSQYFSRRNVTRTRSIAIAEEAPTPAPAAQERSTEAPIQPEFEQIRPMPAEYLAAVKELLELARDGVLRAGLATAPNETTPVTLVNTGLNISNWMSELEVAEAMNESVRVESIAARHDNVTRTTFAHSHLASLLLAQSGYGHNLQAFKHLEMQLDDVTFIMVRDNATVVQNAMDHVLFKRPKFLCINDNMNHSHPNHSVVLEIVQTLFDAYYPEPSTFELPDGELNPFTRLEENRNEATPTPTAAMGTFVPRALGVTQAPRQVLMGREEKPSRARWTLGVWGLVLGLIFLAGVVGRVSAWARRRSK